VPLTAGTYAVRGYAYCGALRGGKGEQPFLVGGPWDDQTSSSDA